MSKNEILPGRSYCPPASFIQREGMKRNANAGHILIYSYPSHTHTHRAHTHTPRTHTHTLPPSFPPPLRQAFGSLDTIGDGFIHASEIEAYFKDKAAGHLLVEHMIKTLDTNNDGKVLLSS